MQSDIHEDAERIASEFRAIGRSVSVAHSTNRNGDFSSYLEVQGIQSRLRVSDHFSGTTDALDFGPSYTANGIIEALARGADINAERATAEAAKWTRVHQERADLEAARAVRAAQKDAWLEANGYSADLLAGMRYEDRKRVKQLAHEATK